MAIAGTRIRAVPSIMIPIKVSPDRQTRKFLVFIVPARPGTEGARLRDKAGLEQHWDFLDYTFGP
jgi:hypothetical protein